jgi:hypothetical protein
MTTNPFEATDYLGGPVIVSRGYQLRALLAVCERAASSLNDVGDGPYRENIVSSLGTTLELAESVAADLLEALEWAAPRRPEKGGDA